MNERRALGSKTGRAWSRGVGVRSQGWWPSTAIGLLVTLLFGWVALAAAQAPNGISSPLEGDTVSGIVLVEGTATDPAFLRYELAFNRGADWIVFAEGTRPVQQGTLAVWDTTVGYPNAPVFPDGTYQLRLRVVRQDHNYDEYFVRDLALINSGPTPTATAPTPDGATQAAATPSPSPAAGTSTPGEQPLLLPSLTPFPTPTAPATAGSAVAAGGRPDATPVPESERGWAQRLQAIDTGQFGRAFWLGARIAVYAFAILAAYFVLRGLARRLSRHLSARMEDGGAHRR